MDSHNGQTIESPSSIKGTIIPSLIQFGHLVNPLMTLFQNYNIYCGVSWYLFRHQLFTLNKNEIIVFFLTLRIMKVLHIDDSPEICALYSDMFTVDHHSVRSVNSGKEGLELVLKNNYDLILLDMCMPKYSGFDFLLDLKHRRPSELSKVVVVSALEMNSIQEQELLDLGIRSILRKPISLDSLLSQIEQAVSF